MLYSHLDTVSALADYLGYSSKEELRLFLYGSGRNTVRYKEFAISKQNGDKRIIHAPYPKTKAIQEKISEILFPMYAAKSCVHGFVKQRSIDPTPLSIPPLS